MPVRPRLTPAIANARRAIRECFETTELGDVKSVILAVSGGPDSMALAAAAAFELPKLSISCSALVVDHGLQSDSETVAAKTVDRLKSLGIAAQSIRVKVRATGSGLEAAARDARYQALREHKKATGATAILLAHNLDDQAETVLLGLTRGSGLRSIAGMKLVDGDLVRPFLAISKSELQKACTDAGIEFWEDPHNQDAAFTRVRIRQLLPTLEKELGPGISEALARSADLAREADDYLSLVASELISNQDPSAGVSVKVFETHPAVRRKALQLLALKAGAREVSRAQVLLMEGLITDWHGQKPLRLSGITVERVSQVLRFHKPQ